MKSKIWADWNELKDKILGRRVFFYGCSQDWSMKALIEIDKKLKALSTMTSHYIKNFF